MLIIVIVALNWSPIDHGLSDGGGIHATGEGPGPYPPTVTRLDLNLNRATMSSVLLTDTAQMGCIQNTLSRGGGGGALADAATKQGNVAVVVNV